MISILLLVACVALIVLLVLEPLPSVGQRFITASLLVQLAGLVIGHGPNLTTTATLVAGLLALRR
jgi:hypothetical protein